MEIGFRDIIYIGVYVITVATMWSNFKNDLKATKKDTEKISKILHDRHTGEISFVNRYECKESKTVIQSRIDKGQETTARAFSRIEEMNQNIILIMYHLNIDRELIDRRPKH